MHIRVSNGYRVRRDVHDKHVGISRADVVLDQELAVTARRGRREPRMVEPQPRRAIDASHECANEVTIFRSEIVDTRAVQHLGGDGLLQAVKHLMQVHHQ